MQIFRNFKIISFVFFLSLQALAISDFMLPQPMPKSGPWFEGWYYRFTDVQNKRSFTILASRTAPKDWPLYSQSQSLPGYVLFLLKPSEFAKTESYEFFPSNAVVIEDPAKQNFLWRAKEIGELTKDRIQMTLPNGDQISVQMSARLPWSQDGDNWGPNGIASFLNFFPLQWWVESLGSEAEYKITRKNGEVIQGHAFAHQEKNWGDAFPTAWIWTQATSNDNRSHFVMSGGPLSIGPLTITTFLVGYKSPKYDVEIRPDEMFDARFEKEIDAAHGRLVMRASNSEYSLRIEAIADPRSFGSVSIPTENGFIRNKGKESFSAKIRVDLWQSGSLLETQVFEGAALEFGGDYDSLSPLK